MADSDDIVKLAKHVSDLIAENTALQARVERLEGFNEAMREAGDEIWYCVRHAQRVDPQDLIDAIEGWRDARNNG
jgi:hypothetical protein